MRATRAKTSRSSNVHVYVEVLQNGAVMAKTCRPLRRTGMLALTSSGRGELALPHYPLPNGRLEFLKVDAQGAHLVVDHKWEGFCTSGGKLVSIARGEKGRSVLDLTKGDYGSITHDDLRILVKIAPLVAKSQDPHRTNPAYRRSFLGFLVSGRDDRLTLSLGGLVAAAIVGAFLFGLSAMPHQKPQSIEELHRSYVLPFVAADHLRTSPEALRSYLNRENYVSSVLRYYKSLAAVFMGWSQHDQSRLFPTTVDLYDELHQEAREEIQDKLTRQKKFDSTQLLKNGVGVITIPAVVGESVTGSMLRVIDKISLMHQAFDLNLEAKAAIKTAFNEENEYDYEAYRSVPKGNTKAAEFLAKVRVWKKIPDEELMYATADQLAQQAASLRAPIRQSKAPEERLDPWRDAPLGLKEASPYASFVQDVDFALLDEKLYQIQASEYGEPQTRRIREPLVGEIDPKLIEKYITQHRFQLQLCYELALRRNEQASGVMEWRWRIDTRGVISDVELVDTTIRDQRMLGCVRQKISSWRFPRPRRGSVQVSYPFEFHPAKG